MLAHIISGQRLTAADGLDSAEWQEAWSGSDDGDELDQLEVTKPPVLTYSLHRIFIILATVGAQFSVNYAAFYRLSSGCCVVQCGTIPNRWSGARPFGIVGRSHS